MSGIHGFGASYSITHNPASKSRLEERREKEKKDAAASEQAAALEASVHADAIGDAHKSAPAASTEQVPPSGPELQTGAMDVLA